MTMATMIMSAVAKSTMKTMTVMQIMTRIVSTMSSLAMSTVATMSTMATTTMATMARVTITTMVTMTRMSSAATLAHLAVTLTTAGALANPDARRLYDDLLRKSGYNKLIRPVSNSSDLLTVKLGLRLSQLIDVVSIIWLRNTQLLRRY